jgi:predicted phosphodiesterase
MWGQNDGLRAVLKRPQPSTWQQFIEGPCLFLAKKLYEWHRITPFESINPITVVCTSDTHNNLPLDIPTGEILIHAGDMTQNGTLEEIQSSLDWLNSLPHPHKIVIAGNHDVLLDDNGPHGDPVAKASLNWGNIIYLDSKSTTVSCANGRRLNLYGSPLTPKQGNWAFQYPRNKDIWQSKIPADTDILITHGPPKCHLDVGLSGCKSLLDEIWRKKPRLHVFGHIHAGYGVEWIQFDGLQRAYEDTVIASEGLWNLGRVLVGFLLAYLAPMKESRALFVNPAMVGGHRDDQRRRPITVHI